MTKTEKELTFEIIMTVDACQYQRCCNSHVIPPCIGIMYIIIPQYKIDYSKDMFINILTYYAYYSPLSCAIHRRSDISSQKFNPL